MNHPGKNSKIGFKRVKGLITFSTIANTGFKGFIDKVFITFCNCYHDPCNLKSEIQK